MPSADSTLLRKRERGLDQPSLLNLVPSGRVDAASRRSLFAQGDTARSSASVKRSFYARRTEAITALPHYLAEAGLTIVRFDATRVVS